VNKELIIRSHSSAVDFALLKDGKLIELNKEVEDNNFSVGDIFVGKVRKAMPGLNAAFVDVGHEKDGFLHYHDLGPKFPSLVKYIKQISTGKNKDYLLKQFRYENDIEKDGNVGDAISPKQTVLVQVVKEPISTKGPRLSSEISLAGRFMVLMPFSDRVSISQKIEDRAEKNRLKKTGSKYSTQRFWSNYPYSCGRTKSSCIRCGYSAIAYSMEKFIEQTKAN
jgi:ribonuclease G